MDPLPPASVIRESDGHLCSWEADSATRMTDMGALLLISTANQQG